MILETALQVVDRFDPGHADRVAKLTFDLSQALGYEKKDAREFYLAARYHDIGKIAIPKAVLQKRGELTQEETRLLQKHVEYGMRMTRYIKNNLIRSIIATHHEHWDGNGYPHRLKGENIPLCGRIVAICDVYDALTTDRPYRAAWSHDKAASYIRERSGTQFDPFLVEPFLRVVVPVGGTV